MSWLDDVARVVLDLLGRQSDQPLQDRLAAAQRVRSELPAEPVHVRIYLDELISAAQFTARGILPAARARLSGAVPLIELSPMLGYLVFRVAAADPERTGEAHDLVLRLLEPALAATAPPSIPPVTAMARYDMAASAMLADALPPTGDVNDSLWRAWVLLSVGRADAAAEMLAHLLQDGPGDVRKTLAACRGLVERCVLGRPEVARRLLDSVIPRLQPRSSLSSATLHSLVMLVDACSDEGRALAFVQRLAPDATEEDFLSWASAASQSEFQRAAAAFACAGLAATGSHACADLAVFRLAASDGARRAIEIALATDWAPDHPRLDLLFERCVQVAENDDQLLRLAARAASLGLDVATRDGVLGGSKYEEMLNALALHTLDQDGPGKALSLAQRTAFADHRTPAALALWVDFHIELGRLDDALAIAEQLVGAWPDHPLPHLKVAQCLMWLDLRAETEASLLAAADRLARLPRAAIDVLKALARYDLDGARWRAADAIADPAFAAVAPELRRLHDDLLAEARV
jgi:tetratricopeptide (TPR) repeat protein